MNLGMQDTSYLFAAERPVGPVVRGSGTAKLQPAQARAAYLP